VVEPVSPELALIDPELARADLARGDPSPAAPIRRQVSVATPAARPPARRRLAAPILLSVSLAANGFLLATLAADKLREYPVVSASAAATSVEAATTALPESSSVEQRILAIVLQAPRGKLPPSLIDPTTGLAKDNLQAVCRSMADFYSCIVRPARHRPGEGLRARYRDGRVTWYPYRGG
jgi:hypothetical protein